jgi:membrane-bound lytic murein transglycosylase F
MKCLFAVCFCIIFFACLSPDRNDAFQSDLKSLLLDDIGEADIDLDSIRARDTLIALTRYNAHNYFIYRGTPMGYEYELLTLFAEELGVQLEIKTPASRDSLEILLRQGQGDLIADNCILTLDKKQEFAFSMPHNTTRQVLVQRKPFNWESMRYHELERSLIRSVTELAGKTMVIPQNTHYEQRIYNLIDETGVPIRVQRVSRDMETEQLIKLVNDGIIDYTLANENVARLNGGYYRNVDIKTPAGFDQRIGWMFRQTSPKLKEAADSWMRKIRFGGSPTYNIIYNKYYGDVQNYAQRRRSEHYILETGAVSPFDSLFKKHETERFSWKLLAAIAYEESNFNPTAVSRFGATGLMQLLPATAQQFGIFDLLAPDKSIEAAVRYLEYVYTRHWSHLPPEEAIHFVLASYNAGPGHVLDAQRIADLEGYDSTRWFGNVEQAILKLSHREYYYLEEVKHGYCRGIEPKNYVENVMTRYNQYQQVLHESDQRKQNLLETFGRDTGVSEPDFTIE